MSRPCVLCLEVFLYCQFVLVYKGEKLRIAFRPKAVSENRTRT